MKLKIISACLVVSLAASISSAFAGQPHMQAALAQLRVARTELEKANADKGGHRKNAMALIDKTIAEVEMGEAAAAAVPARR